MGIYLATAIALILYLVLAWFAGSWLRLQGPNLWLVRVGLAVIGITGAGLFLWFRRKLTRDSAEAGIGPGAPILTEIEALLNQADSKLKAAKPTAGASLRTLPVVLLVGEPNSAKTSTMLHSGLDPELLAGVVHRDTETVPTNTLNLWYARGTVLIEIGGAIVGETKAWVKVLNRISPSSFASAFGKGVAAPRAVVVCFDCERLQGGSEKLISTARRLSSPLQGMANELGASFPVYVLFTKLDQVPKFAEFVANLTTDEARQVLGVTMAQRDPRQGMFAEEEKTRLGRELDQIVYSLAEKRLDYLSRESALPRIPAIYEFPREFRKLRDAILTFLVELARPSQLGTNPFLRGFYFSGLRPVMVRENVTEPLGAPLLQEAAPAGATRLLSVDAGGGRLAASPRTVNVVRSRKVPEWTFLPYLFGEVILRDRAALSTSSQSTKADVIRRLLLATLAVAFLCAAIAFLVSFTNNRSLQHDVMAASAGLAMSAPSAVDVPTVDQLKSLDRLRETLVTLEASQKAGASLSYRFGLYDGDQLYPEARRIYFGYFRRLLLDSTQKSIIAMLRQLPSKPDATSQYGEPYGVLKAYLIITGRHDKSSKEFLTPILLQIWSGKGLDSDRTELARRQFDYYSDAIIPADPYRFASDKPAVDNARNYLSLFNGTERIYQNMLARAGKGIPTLNFNRQFPGSAQVVSNAYEVSSAFTREGFVAMQNALQHPQDFFGGEEWVLGDSSGPTINQETLQQDLTKRYNGDFVNQWRNFLQATRIVGYASLKDASSKLQVLSANNSPLLQLLCVVQKNTADIPGLATTFQPVQTLAKDCSDQKLVTSGNQQYMSALLNLQNSVAALATNPAPQPDTAPVLTAAAAAQNTVGTIAQGFRIDNEGHVDAAVKKLMDDPITYVESLAGKVAPGALNGAGKIFCGQYNVLAGKYPFSASPVEATLQEIASVFQPGAGALWTFYDQNLKTILLRQGSQFSLNPAAPMHVSPQFISFMNHAATVSEALYPAGSQQPHFTYALQQLPSKGIEKLSLAIDDQTLSGDGQTKQFGWTGSATATVKGNVSYSGNTLQFANDQGIWALFHFLDGAKWTPASPPTLEWPMEIGHAAVKLPDGTPVVIRYELTSGAQMFRRESLGMRCPPVGAK
jgi:type VI secretion system protein ImpL